MIIPQGLHLIKAHYFLSQAGNSPITPFIPVIGKDLGFSSIAVGWIFTIAPILSIFCKPLIGSIADKFSCRKFAFIIMIFFQGIGLLSLKWVPSVPSDNLVNINCTNGLSISTCSDKLKDESYSRNVLQTLNSSLVCELNILQTHEPNKTNNSTAQQSKDQENKVFIKLKNGQLKNGCVSIETSAASEICNEQEGRIAQLHCINDALYDLTKKPKIKETDFIFTYQYWIFFSIVIGLKIIQSTALSFADTFTFDLLGNKPENYGAQRMWGAIGWGLTSIAGGFVVDRMSAGKIEKDYTVCYYFCFITLLVTCYVDSLIPVNHQHKPENILKDVKRLFKSAKTNIFIAWSIIGGIYVSFIWNYLFWFIEDLASRNGSDSRAWIKTLEGLAMTIETCVGEMPFFFLSGWITRKIGLENCMRLVLFTFGLRFLIYSTLTNPWWILPFESLNGITFGLFYSTMTIYASTIAPPGTEATVQNLVTGLFEGVGTAIGGLIGGYLFTAIGTSRTFFMLGLSAISFGVLLIMLQLIYKDDKTVYYNGVNAETKEAENEKEKEANSGNIILR